MQVLNAHQPGFDSHDLEVLQVLCGQAAAAIETARLTQQARKAEIVNIIGDISHDIKNMLTPIQTGMWTLQPMMEQLFSDLDIVCEECRGRKAADDIGRVMSLIRDDYSWIFRVLSNRASRCRRAPKKSPTASKANWRRHSLIRAISTKRRRKSPPAQHGGRRCRFAFGSGPGRNSAARRVRPQADV
jgi:signal transduction histidine kinase